MLELSWVLLPVSGKKGNQQETPGTLADVQAGGRVVLVVKGGRVEEVKVHGKAKKKNKADK